MRPHPVIWTDERILRRGEAAAHRDDLDSEACELTIARQLVALPGELYCAAAEHAGNRLICGGRDPHRRNVTCPLVSRLAGGSGLPAMDTGRLRPAWLADAAALTGLPAFMHAAGITCSQRLGDIIAGLEPGGEEHAVTLPGGTAR